MSDEIFEVFLVDDDSKQLLILKNKLESLSDLNIKVHLFSSGENCLKEIGRKPEIVVLDYHLDANNKNAKNGHVILEEILAKQPDTSVIMMSAQEDMQIAIDSFERGAYDYIIKSETALLRIAIVVGNIINSTLKAKEKAQSKRLENILIGLGLGIGLALFGSIVYSFIMS